MRKAMVFLGRGLGSGLLKPAPGTWGSLLALVIGYIVHLPLWFIILAAFAGVYICDVAEKEIGIHDAPEIVFDEFVGMWIALWAIPVVLYPVAFILFRLFDITKIFPVNNLQNLPGGWGIMMDDVAAGIMARIVLGVIM